MILFIKNNSFCEICEDKKKTFVYVDELELSLCINCNNKYENNICLSCNNKILDKDFVSNCFCIKCFD